MAARIYANNVSTKLTAQLLVAGVTANVTAGDGALFAGATGGDWIIATLRRMSGFKDVAREIVKITARSTDALTIVRAQESTAALQFEIGDTLDIDVTAASLQTLSRGIATETTAARTVAAADSNIIVNYAGICTLTLPAAASFPGRELTVRTITANTVVSASGNVVPLAGGGAGTAILAATAGKWATLVSDATNWQIMAAA